TRNSFQIGTGLQLIDGTIPDFNLNFNTSIVTDNSKSGLFLFGTKRNRQAFDANNDGFSEIAMLKNNSIGFSGFHKITDKITLSLDFHSLNEFRRGGNDFNKLPHLTDITEQIEHEIIGGGINFDYKSKDYKTKFAVFASGQFTNRDSYYGAEKDPAAYGLTKDFSQVTGVQFSHKFDHLLFAPVKIVVGAENVYSKLTDTKLGFYDEELGAYQEDRLLVNQELFTPGTYAQTEWDFKIIKLLIGARYDVPDKRLDISPVFMPRANALIKLGNLTKIRLSYAKGYRAPQIFDEDLHIESSAARKLIHKHSDNLTAEISNSLSGSLDFTKNFNNVQTYFLAEYFYTKLENPFSNEFIFDLTTKELTLLKTNATSGAWVKGINFEAKIAFSSSIEFQMGGTVQKSQYVDGQAWGDNELYSTKDFTRTPNQYGYFVAYYKPFKSTNIAFTGNYTGSMLIPHLAGGNDADGNLITDDELLVTNPFYDFGFSISQNFNISDETKIELSGGIKNIFNSYQNDFDSGKYRDAGFIYGPILPRTFILSIKIGSR
ncbi:MAG: TonB-dependent receptor, partial [Bacteroidota bacterium]|nr:TonB-dependent receptor [Bacteroidota bacterium]